MAPQATRCISSDGSRFQAQPRGSRLATSCIAFGLGCALVSGPCRAESSGSASAAAQRTPNAEAAGSSSTGTYDSKPVSGFSRVFWYGPSPGEPSAAKSVVVFTLYGAGIASAVLGGLQLADKLSVQKDVERLVADNPAACSNRGSEACGSLTRLQDKEDTADYYALLGLAGTGVAWMSGLVLALLWQNEAQPPVQVSAVPLYCGASTSPNCGLWLNARFAF